MSQLTEIIKELSGRHSADIFILSGNINDNTADQLINYIRRLSTKNKNCILILTTYGGDPDAGYRIARCIKQYYQKPGKFILYVFGYCKSTGTLIALGADEIVVGDLAEFGPLDIQLDQADEFASTSG